MKKYFTLIAILLISSVNVFARTMVTQGNINSIINKIYMEAALYGLLLALVAMVLVSMRKYDLVDNRIRKQKDVLMRRVTFFSLLLVLPILWFFMTSSWMYDEVSKVIMHYQWSRKTPAHGTKLMAAYVTAGTTILSLSFIAFYVLFSWLFARFLNKWKAWTVIYSNFKILGIINTNKK